MGAQDLEQGLLVGWKCQAWWGAGGSCGSPPNPIVDTLAPCSSADRAHGWGPAHRAAATANPHRRSGALLSGPNELLNNLHAPDPRNQASQDGGLVAQACADLEHVIAWLRVEKVGHERDHEWL